jgi:phage terminase large subunit-like protein
MQGALRNQIRTMKKEVSELRTAVQSEREQLRQAALYALSDRQLKSLAAADPDPEAVSAYRRVLDAAARRAGWTCPSGELPVDAIAQEFTIRSRSKLYTMFPDEGEFRRELYPKQLEFFRAGRDHREVAFIAGNRCGKSEAGAYQTALHLTGRYPEWWEGRRFAHPVNVWVVSDTNQTTRDILQTKLLGRLLPGLREAPGPGRGLGTGMLPCNAIQHTRPKSALPGAIDFAHIRHVSGGLSTLTFKSYEQGREAFQGTAQDLIVCDEEPPKDVYLESLMRTMATGTFAGGLMLLLFTPMNGWSDVVEMFFNREERQKADRYCLRAGWDDVPHLSWAEKTSMLAAYPEYQRDARSKGIPQLGSGAIYPLAESETAVDPFQIPAHWPRSYAMDVGWNRTAALWLAQDPESRKLYVYAEHYFAHSEPSENARAIRALGEWIPGVIDPAARSRSQADGTQLIAKYRELGLHVRPAKNAVDAGLLTVWDLLKSNRLKIFKSLANFWQEFRLYRRDDRGRVVKGNDHLMDCLRYAVMSRDHMKTAPAKNLTLDRKPITSERGWMA